MILITFKIEGFWGFGVLGFWGAETLNLQVSGDQNISPLVVSLLPKAMPGRLWAWNLVLWT